MISAVDHQFTQWKFMGNQFYHVLVKMTDGEAQMLFSDLTRDELSKQFVKPYKRGQTFFSGPRIVDPIELKSIQIIKTTQNEEVERARINRQDLDRIEKMNRNSSVFILSPGAGYEPGDLLEAGTDVTRDYIKGGPGGARKFSTYSKRVLAMIGAIVTGAVGTGLAKWMGWN